MSEGKKVRPLEFSIGGWCLVNPGGDPFGDTVRNIGMEHALAILSDTPVKKVSFHDRDLWPDDAPMSRIEDIVCLIKEQTAALDLEVYNFTANLFSNPCFRSGAFSSPFPEVRTAALVKGTHAMDAAHAFGAKNVIWWGGREGTDGAYERDTGEALRDYMCGIRTCLLYGLGKDYVFKHTIEPKVYEPRLLGLYAGTGSAAASAIRHFFPGDLRYWVKVNPEYPQHVAMLGLDPVLELGQLLEEDMLADFIHFGGQIVGRMDCDLPPGFGSNPVTDFMLCLTLHRRGWQGVVEFDCRPPRTTVTENGSLRFITGAVDYWKALEERVEVYLNDEQTQCLDRKLCRIDPELDVLMNMNSPAEVVEAVKTLQTNFRGFPVVAEVDTDIIEAYQRRVRQIVLGQK